MYLLDQIRNPKLPSSSLFQVKKIFFYVMISCFTSTTYGFWAQRMLLKSPNTSLKPVEIIKKTPNK